MIRVGPDVKGSGTVDDPWIPLSAQKRYGALVSPRVSAPDSSAHKQFEEWRKSLPPCALVTGKNAAAPTTRWTANHNPRVWTLTVAGMLPYNVESHRHDGCIVRILQPGCFDKSVRSGRDIRLQLDHDEERAGEIVLAPVLATTAKGNLRLKSDWRGLHYEADLAMDMAELVVRLGCRISPGWRPLKHARKMEAGVWVDRYHEAELLEISFVSSPDFWNSPVRVL